MKQNNCKVIGLTGGIGTGKSRASFYLKSKGFPVVDADQIAREVVCPGEPAYIRLIDAFGQEILNPDQTINRKKLGSLVFNDSKLLELLSTILHPAIRERIAAQIKKYCEEYPLVFADIPLLIETGMMSDYDIIWLVYAPENLSLLRIMERDGLTESDAIARIRSQIPIDEKVKIATRVIDNTKDLQSLYDQLDQELSRLNSL